MKYSDDFDLIFNKCTLSFIVFNSKLLIAVLKHMYLEAILSTLKLLIAVLNIPFWYKDDCWNLIFLFQIYADRNLISEVGANTFSDLSNLTKINLTGNRLDKFPLNALALQLGKNFIFNITWLGTFKRLR